MRPVLGLLVLNGSCWSGFAGEAVTYGRFEDPLPARDPAKPYIATGPQYHVKQASPSIAEEVYWGIPGTTTDHVRTSPFFTYAASSGTDFIARIVDASGALERDAAGNVVARGPVTPEAIALIGERFIAPVDDGDGGFVIPTGKLEENSNSLRFQSAVVDYEYGVALELGSLTYHNHTSPLGTEITDITFRLGFSSLTEERDQYQTDLVIKIVTTPNVAEDPELSADYIYFADYPQFGSFRVYEGQTASVPLMGVINSLHFGGFGDVVAGGGFLTSSIAPDPTPQAVPDGGPGWLGWVASIGGLGAFVGRRRNIRVERRIRTIGHAWRP
ncbi:MAG: choice-of-anchor K domain-containing protein [Verrucomicrobiales bacterium]|nr:choice-of-anchor K domain-containing protein [Verrucomicrobiales bacterium]